jgi:hypothetical protein
MDGPTESTGCTVWQATTGAAPYLGTTGPTVSTPEGTPTNKTGAGGHPPPKNQTPGGPLPQAVQQLCEHSGDPHGIRKAHVRLPHPSKILPPTSQYFLCWNCALGRCFRGPWCRFAWGHLKKGKSTDSFANCITNVISKWVLHYINLPVG